MVLREDVADPVRVPDVRGEDESSSSLVLALTDLVVDWITDRGGPFDIMENLEVDGQIGPRTLHALRTVSSYRDPS